MKTKIFNYGKLKEKDISDRIVRVKGLIVNSKDEILLVKAFNILQFPGGHLEENETLEVGLKREISEETGMTLNDHYQPFYAIKYFLKDFPVIGNNRSIEIYYFYIFTDKKFNLKHIYLDDQERNGNFNLEYVSLKEFKNYILKNNQEDINKMINREMLLALKVLKAKLRHNKL